MFKESVFEPVFLRVDPINCRLGKVSAQPHTHYAYSPLLEENNSANNRLPLGLFALFSRS